MDTTLEILQRIKALLNNSVHVAAIEAAIADVKRVDFMEQHGIDWDGLSAYFHRQGSQGGSSLRECCDNAMIAIDAKEARKDESTS